MSRSSRCGYQVREATMTAPIILVLGALLLIAGVFYVVLARPRINQWGATYQEHQATWPGDHLVTRPNGSLLT